MEEIKNRIKNYKRGKDGFKIIIITGVDHKGEYPEIRSFTDENIDDLLEYHEDCLTKLTTEKQRRLYNETNS